MYGLQKIPYRETVVIIDRQETLYICIVLKDSLKRAHCTQKICLNDVSMLLVLRDWITAFGTSADHEKTFLSILLNHCLDHIGRIIFRRPRWGGSLVTKIGCRRRAPFAGSLIVDSIVEWVVNSIHWQKATKWVCPWGIVIARIRPVFSADLEKDDYLIERNNKEHSNGGAQSNKQHNCRPVIFGCSVG